VYLGIDIGSTSVKVILLDSNLNIVWKKYSRHETRQDEKLLEMLYEIDSLLSLNATYVKAFITGTGGMDLAKVIGADFVQEVNSISAYIEKRFPEVNSVIELGGQDAKMLLFNRDKISKRVKKVTSMNDKCAGGTGVIIDKIASKLKIVPEEVSNLRYKNVRIHNVAGKCGVFAETDINGLQKLGIPSEELMASLFDSIVLQNLSVLTRGNTLKPKIFLLGGPNSFIKGLVEAWQENIPKIWEERGIKYETDKGISDLISVPENSEFFAAIGSIYFGINFDLTNEKQYKGPISLKYYIDNDIEFNKTNNFVENSTPIFHKIGEFEKEYSVKPFVPPMIERGSSINAFLGIDGGSTTTKAVIMDENCNLLRKYYSLSLGNPIDDTKKILSTIYKEILENKIDLNILSVGVTGYAKNIIKNTFKADVSIVETIAHAKAAQFFYKDIDVICDVGGQDIKIMILKNNAIIDFKLNTQCSAGNGYFLQNTSESFGINVNDYAEHALSVTRYPNFGYGCAVFLQSDIVNFQRKGWNASEILAGLAAVLPKNIWLYVCQIPNLTSLGKNFVLQGGTQYNKAAAKAQIDFIQDRFKQKELKANIVIHKYAGECGAFGAALEAKHNFDFSKTTQFIGLEKASTIKYNTLRDESTRCQYCKNQCLRTFIEIGSDKKEKNDQDKSRIIIASCEKGNADNIANMKTILKEIEKTKKENLNLMDFASKNIWFNYENTNVFDSKINLNILKKEWRGNIVFGIPRVMNLYQYATFFISYLETLGIKKENIIFSDYTTEKLYREGSKRGSIDPCFPSKVSLSHIHDLIFNQNTKKKIDYILFPSVDTIPSDLNNTVDHKTCPSSNATTEVIKAAFTKEIDVFALNNIIYLNPFINLANPEKCSYQLYNCFKDILSISKAENDFAVSNGYKSLKKFATIIKKRGIEVINMVKKEKRLAILFLGRPYHNDYGLNHGIPEEFQKLGYPILSIDSLPTHISNNITSLDISGIWKNSFSENTNKKMWAARFASEYKNLVAIELSNFKCGHDATTYSIVRDIVHSTGAHFFSFRDIDENKPTSSIRIRIETIDYFLKNYILPSLKFE
jgi:predicted CoA-substrate-specific enzyme activase